MAEHRDVIAVGASAGGVEALRALVAGLPPAYPGAVLVVLHIPRDSPSALPGILSRSGPLPAATAVDGEPLRPGRIYVAPNDHHLLLLDGHLRLTRGPAENGHRPAIDPLFRSVARAVGHRGVGVVLSGSRDDGAAGLTSIVRRGGVAVVQDPADALYPWMPRAALAQVSAEHVEPAAKLGGLIAGITAMDLPANPPVPTDDDLLDAEVSMSELGSLTSDQLAVPAAGYGCPSCGGSLFQMTADPVPRYRCRVGHAWSALSRRMASTRNPRHTSTGTRFRDIAEDADTAGETIRRLIDQLGSAVRLPDEEPDAAHGTAPDVR